MRSLETNWLSHFDKSLVRPEVVFTHDPKSDEGESVGGFEVYLKYVEEDRACVVETELR